MSALVPLPVILPLALMLGLLLSFARLYRDSEMPVLTGVSMGCSSSAAS